ncbi:MAG: hypothetical protein JXA96_01955 [Sedimentisphaerales bacterium]|nr:hypothetical protein [Sedimentisphaerales bacterium]
MTNGAAVAAAAAAIANAIKASGAIVSVESTDFMTIVNKMENPLVVYSQSTFFSTKYCYLTSYKGLIFYTKTDTALMLKSSVELIQSKKIWVPG